MILAGNETEEPAGNDVQVSYFVSLPFFMEIWASYCFHFTTLLLYVVCTTIKNIVAYSIFLENTLPGQVSLYFQRQNLIKPFLNATRFHNDSTETENEEMSEKETIDVARGAESTKLKRHFMNSCCCRGERWDERERERDSSNQSSSIVQMNWYNSMLHH